MIGRNAGHGLWTLYKEQIIDWMSDFLYRYVSAPVVGGVAEVTGQAAPIERDGWIRALLPAGVLSTVLIAATIVRRCRTFRSS